MSHYIQMYNDTGYTDLWRTATTIPITYTSISQVKTITLNGKSYKYCDDTACLLSGVSQIKARPLISWTDDDIQEMALYLKNGLQINRVLKESTGVRFENYRYKDVSTFIMSSNNHMINDINQPSMWAIEFVVDGVLFLGFTKFLNTRNGWPGYIVPSCCFELSFWVDSLRPPYSYGQGDDPNGGQGSGGGAFRRTGVDDTTRPAGLIPTSASGRGLHAYVISATNYGDLQNYLWGDNTTTAKALWQKFQNKIHSPASCIVAVYALPADFMPSGGGSVNIRLAGVTLPVTATSVQLDFAEYEVTFDPIEKPFHNFADYSHVTCKMYVPYCGEIPIPVEAAYGRTIKCRYWVDQFNGNLVARVSCGDINIGELSSNVAYRIPIIGGDDGSLDRIGAALTGIAQVSAGNYSGALGSAAEMATAPYTAQIINADFSGSISACTFRRPYIEWTANENYYSDEFLRTRGVPARYAATLSSFSGGYLECITKVNSMNIPSATDAEREEIESILRGGLFV